MSSFNCSRFSIISYSCKKCGKLLFCSHRQNYRNFNYNNYRKCFTRAWENTRAPKAHFYFFFTLANARVKPGHFPLFFSYNSVGAVYVSKNAMSGNWDAGLDVVQLPLPRKPTEKHHLYTTCQPELGHPGQNLAIPSNHHVANVQSHNGIRQNSVKMWHHLAA